MAVGKCPGTNRVQEGEETTGRKENAKKTQTKENFANEDAKKDTGNEIGETVKIGLKNLAKSASYLCKGNAQRAQKIVCFHTMRSHPKLWSYANFISLSAARKRRNVCTSTKDFPANIFIQERDASAQQNLANSVMNLLLRKREQSFSSTSKWLPRRS